MFTVEYHYQDNWVYGSETSSEEEAVRRSRSIWRDPRVTGVRVLRTETSVVKQARR